MNKEKIEELVKEESYRSENFNDGVTVFFNEKEEVIGVSNSETVVIAVKDNDADNNIMLTSFLKNGRIIQTVMNHNRAFVIPNKEVLKSPESIMISPEMFPFEWFPAIYLICHFGLLENSNLEGCPFSHIKFNVMVQQCNGLNLMAEFESAEWTVAGEGNYRGKIKGGYQFATLGEVTGGFDSPEVYLSIG